ncbi:hypothetical protein PV05_05464 [Exophiala xenobiotica]|uniref:Uncharacterized protein n=1 Tax=Exophiala xenobiotica TaxID=348802 RepID=A0A0D2EN53_9EURO|nr:uncharacterized protein PV05_05464 [Exophiala xenobiotica]KIW56843.1 hypothetical protein PV05_05464 [Exophiala xenobiotica]
MVTFTSKGRYPKETKLKAWLACFPAGTTKYRVGFHALKPSEQTAYGAQKQNSIFEITAPRQWNTDEEDWIKSSDYTTGVHVDEIGGELRVP